MNQHETLIHIARYYPPGKVIWYLDKMLEDISKKDCHLLKNLVKCKCKGMK